ncbi:flagellar export chaperone FliS [Herbivorax sp. ANBcel31]|uniref:flagellar export chaperone FliS n=1 Tax=Herbivorax sp. ANBcel31 TaxID=3069754 RepID=UPI0027B241C0|nr:flagellar export chaperone FliS [Herbivorax sp. ANBcel31]MDQ2085089.1 flagellar export chaperone FliS [Herbivorax sp. ANBcel31]
MMNSNPYGQYKENTVYTASSEELTLMLYNGLVKFLMQAQMALNDKKIEKANTAIIKAQAIIAEFQNTLDMNYEVSQQLELLYDYMHRQLLEANVKKEASIVEEVLNMVKELRDTWSQAIKIAKNKNKKAQSG